MELVAVVKRECETCKLVEPVLAQIRARAPLALYSQDDPAFPESLGGATDDTALERSWQLKVETVPTLIRFEAGREISRVAGWDRAEWERVAQLPALGAGLPAFQPGCGSRTQDPGMPERLGLAHGDLKLHSRRIDVADAEDSIEVAYDRGWTDGLPVVPPTPLRVRDDVVGHHAQARRSHRPDSAQSRRVHGRESRGECRHGGLPFRFPRRARSHRSRARPLLDARPARHVVVFGPGHHRQRADRQAHRHGQRRQRAGPGQSRERDDRPRAAARDPQRRRRDFPARSTAPCSAIPASTRSVLPKTTDPSWTPLNVARGFKPGTSTVTLFHGDGVQGITAGKSRTPEGLAKSLALGLSARSWATRCSRASRRAQCRPAGSNYALPCARRPHAGRHGGCRRRRHRGRSGRDDHGRVRSRDVVGGDRRRRQPRHRVGHRRPPSARRCQRGRLDRRPAWPRIASSPSAKQGSTTTTSIRRETCNT